MKQIFNKVHQRVGAFIAARFEGLFMFGMVMASLLSVELGMMAISDMQNAPDKPATQVAETGTREVVGKIRPLAKSTRAERVSTQAQPVQPGPLIEVIKTKYNVSQPLAKRIVQAANGAAKDTGVSPTLILAVAARESSFDPKAVNNKDLGLMQVNRKWHADKVREAGGVQAMFHPETNLKVGSRILASFVGMESGSEWRGLRRYNGKDKTNAYPDEVLSLKRDFDQALRLASL